MDSEYLKKHVGDALMLGMSEVVQKRPVDPVEYLAFWLRKFVVNRDFEFKVSRLLNNIHHYTTAPLVYLCITLSMQYLSNATSQQINDIYEHQSSIHMSL